MAVIFNLLNAVPASDLPGYHRRRLWVQVGYPMVIGPRLLMRIEVDQVDGRPQPYVVIEGPGVRHTLPIATGTALNLEAWAGLRVIPRAAVANRRYLLEFVAVRRGVKFA